MKKRYTVAMIANVRGVRLTNVELEVPDDAPDDFDPIDGMTPEQIGALVSVVEQPGHYTEALSDTEWGEPVEMRLQDPDTDQWFVTELVEGEG